ncbi:peptidase C1 [Rhodoferax koreense]|uniref:Peptidase C1 n=1 Tax=Rhodoferax koreensis TaxID=1842727 RepID=A0A1P8JYQ8_9BURK|nr:C1 family peptidase [Rhodoferax koreense]APW38890.1 peptidase C1 [Rhodoferax koreense]
MKQLMTKGDAGADVDRLRKALAAALGADAAGFPVLKAAAGGAIDDEFDAAIRRWQSGIGVIADGIVGPRCQLLLGLSAPSPLEMNPAVNVGNVSQLFPATKPANIARYLPYIEAALGSVGLSDRAMVLGALGTIRAETEGFVPISEFQSKFNTPPGGAPFSSYDMRTDIGNGARGDGERYRGRGFVQLTGKANYKTYGERIGFDLVDFPDKANAPEVAAVILAQFLADKAVKFRAAVAAGDLRAARRLVNGGAHGLESFSDVFARASRIWPDMPATPAKRTAGAKARAKAGKAPVMAAATPAQRRTSLTKKDAADLRDRLFQPPAVSLPDEFPEQKQLTQFLPAYTGAKLILDQGREGACTGFGLTCVINYLRWVKGGWPAEMESVSPRMLYTLARRHDEYEGENYDGSSCRGALKGWFNNGVCLESSWPYEPEKSNPAKYGFATQATQNTLGVYYRIDTKSITDMQAAIHQHLAIFVSAFTHAGWDDVPWVKKPPKQHADLPRIAFDGRPATGGGHAFALVGFNAHGFILQNSWGTKWGAGGFAVISYLDWLANGMDAWVVSLGVPGVVAGRLAVAQGTAGALAGADKTKWWDTGLAYQHSVVLGNDGRVSRYLTEDEQPRKLQKQVYALPDEWFRAQKSAKKRLVLYVHGGLNSEADAIKRASAMGRFFVANGCYPLFLVWKTGLFESIGDIISDRFKRQPTMAGAGEWFSEKTDLLIEKTIGRPLARPIWSEMKENAELAFAPRRGGELLLDALQALAATWGEQFELHLMGHSAGSIALGHLLTALAARQNAQRDDGLGGRLTSINLYAPACSVAFANAKYASNANVMDRLYLDVLSDRVERGDNVASIYRKSLLYFVSNCLESDLRAPILGLDRINDTAYSGWDGSSDTGEALSTWRTAAAQAQLASRTSLVGDDRIPVALEVGGAPVLQPAGHGSFDNDITVVTRTLRRITGGELELPVDDLRGY